MPDTTRLVSAEELERLPSDQRYELVDGRLVPMTPVGYTHGRIVVRLVSMLDQHVRAHDLGVVLTEVGFKLSKDPDTVRAPDVAFIRRDRIPKHAPVGFWSGAPDLAIEVLSPDDSPGEVDRKTTEYLRAGTRLVLVVDPEQRTVTSSVSNQPANRARDVVDLGAVLPGLGWSLSHIFD